MTKDKLSTAITDVKGCLFDYFANASNVSSRVNYIVQLNVLLSEAAAALNDLERVIAETEYIKNGSKQG